MTDRDEEACAHAPVYDTAPARRRALPVDSDAAGADREQAERDSASDPRARGAAGVESSKLARPRGWARVQYVGERVRGVIRERWDVLGVIAVGGALGSVARWQLSVRLPHPPDGFAWATFDANVTGCLLLGVLMVFVTDVWAPSRYVRPFLGVGVLGGFTTFSTYMLDARNLLVAGRTGTAAAYVFGSVAAGLVAVWVGVTLARLAPRIARRRLSSSRQGRRATGSAAKGSSAPTPTSLRTSLTRRPR